jgi:hypothetical protein
VGGLQFWGPRGEERRRGHVPWWWDAREKVKALLGLDAESRKRWNSGRVPRTQGAAKGGKACCRAALAPATGMSGWGGGTGLMAASDKRWKGTCVMGRIRVSKQVSST